MGNQNRIAPTSAKTGVCNGHFTEQPQKRSQKCYQCGSVILAGQRSNDTEINDKVSHSVSYMRFTAQEKAEDHSAGQHKPLHHKQYSAQLYNVYTL